MEIFIVVWLFFLGSILGSFLACMGYRIPNKIKATYPSSYCESCKKPLNWYMNIPIFSYIFYKGKCKYCNSKINPLYFVCEILGALLIPFNYLLFHFNVEFFVSSIISCVLIVTIVSDFLYYYISDRVIVISSILLLIVLFVFCDMNDIIFRVISAVILFFVMIGIKILGNSMFEKESLGDGDIKLMGVIALSVGLLNSFIALFFASLIGLIFSFIIRKKNKEGIIAFGPFLLIGALMVMYLYPLISSFFEGLISI